MIPSFQTRAKQWSSPPVDDVGYIPSTDMLEMPSEELSLLVANFELARYHGWRNYQNRWRDVLGLDTTHAKHVLDYGCGVGIEALQYARAGNTVSLADISGNNVKLADRVLKLHGFKSLHTMVVKETGPLLPLKPETVDVVHCNGVLHHIPDPIPVIKAMHGWLKPEGELRLMLYSDHAWEIATGTLAPEGDVFDYEEFDAFWQHWDPLGGYADWYDAEKLRHRFGKWFRISRFEPLDKTGAYVGAVLVKREEVK